MGGALVYACRLRCLVTLQLAVVFLPLARPQSQMYPFAKPRRILRFQLVCQFSSLTCATQSQTLLSKLNLLHFVSWN